MKRPFIAGPVRERIVTMLEKRCTYTEVADAFSVGIATVNRIWRRFRETGLTTLPPRGGGQRPKIGAKDEKKIRRLVESMPDATYVELTVAWRRISNANISRATIVRKVLELGYSRKKKSNQASEKKSPKNKSKRQRFLRAIRSVTAKRLVFLDEAGFQAKQGRTHARSLRGTKAVVYSSGGYSKNFTMVGAIRLSGPIVMKGSSKSMTTKKFISFLKTSLFPRLSPKDILVLDNLRAHRSQRVRQLAHAWGIRMIFLPPYSPEYNPIEQVWGWMKHRLRYRIQRAASCFRYAIAGAWRKAARLSYAKLFHHCGYSISGHAI